MTNATLKIDLLELEANYNESLDTLWMILAAILVFFMHAGFSLLEAGSVRFKSTHSILAKNLFVVTAGFLCWYVMGYALALGVDEDDPGKFAGSTGFFLGGFWEDQSNFRVWFFQGAFCATGATIVSGAMAERTQLRGFGVFTMLMTSIIYPCVVYWSWSGVGFLSYTDDEGKSVSIVGPAYMDFAGSGVVHMVGGMAALVGAAVVGPRTGRYAKPDEFEAQSIPFITLGTFFLWFGWYGFNPGSTGSLHGVGAANTVGRVAVNTTLAPCVSGLLVFLWRARGPAKHVDVGGFCNGILAGLVSITAGCANVAPWESIIIGFIGGVIYQVSSRALSHFRVDDVVDAFPVHGACGCWGVLALGFFGGSAYGGNGWFHGGDQLGTQMIAVILIILWSVALSLLILVALKRGGLLRVIEDGQDSCTDPQADTKECSSQKVDCYVDPASANGHEEVEKGAMHGKAKEFPEPYAKGEHTTAEAPQELSDETFHAGSPKEMVPKGGILPEGPYKLEPNSDQVGCTPHFPRKWLQSACATGACIFRC